MAKIAAWHPAGQAFTMGASSVGGPDTVGGAAKVYHDSDACPTGKAIPAGDRAPGDGGYPRCPECANLS